MTSEERSSITNGIWLCATCADLIDDDAATYTADELRAMKREHEANCNEELLNPSTAVKSIPDLIAVGPNIVFRGDFLGFDNSEWSFRLRNFVEGDLGAVLAFVERFDELATNDRYILANFLGDGRVLGGAPSMFKEQTGGYVLRCPVLPSADRIPVTELPRTYELSTGHDLMLRNGNIAIVSGLAALPQQVKTCLSHQRGESPIYHDFGTRFAEYYRLLSDSPWLNRLLKLEAIRQAAIPYVDTINNRRYTPLLCVNRVFEIDILAGKPTNNWLPIRVDLDVKGLGRWRRELSICVPLEPIVRRSLQVLLAGPIQP